MKAKRVYVLVMIEGSIDNGPESFAIEPLGVFTSEKKAMRYVEEMYEATPKSDDVEIAYDIFDFDLDVKPFMLSFLEKQKEVQKDLVQDMIIDLMKEGMVDQLIGEDGHFYYTLTDLGQKTYNEMKGGVPENVKKFLRKKHEED